MENSPSLFIFFTISSLHKYSQHLQTTYFPFFELKVVKSEPSKEDVNGNTWFDFFPLSFLDQLFIDFIIGFEEFIKSLSQINHHKIIRIIFTDLITISNVPGNNSTRLDNSDQFSECLRNYRSREHACTAQEGIISVVCNLEIN